MGIIQEYRENRPVREYNSFCKKYKFCEGKDITVKVKEKFAVDFKANYSLPPEYHHPIDKVESKDKEIELVNTEEFYPYPYGWCGGYTHVIYVFKATKKGTYKINFTSYTINVIVN